MTPASQATGSSMSSHCRITAGSGSTGLADCAENTRDQVQKYEKAPVHKRKEYLHTPAPEIKIGYVRLPIA